MAKIPINIGGGGGTTSDDCTAVAADVLAGKTAIYNGSDDEAANGSMTDKSGTTSSASVNANSSSARLELTVPETGKYDTAAKLYTSYSSLASAAGLTAAKIATGNTILGVAGSYTGVGTATADKVLSGYTFSSGSLSGASGTMTDKSGTTSSASSSVDSSNSRVRLQIPTNGYYNTSAYLYASYADIASVIGLTAAKIKKGTTILGIAGTYAGTDYGDTVKLYANKYVTIGYSRDDSTIYAGADGSTYGSTYVSVGGKSKASDGMYFWFPTQQKMDLRAYNYAAVLVYYYPYRANTGGYSPTTYFRPFFALSDNINGYPANDTIIYGSDDSTGTKMDMNTDNKICTLIDLSNCTAESKYLKFGYQIGSANVLSNPNIYARLNIGEDIILYKNKSDCNINTSDYAASFTLTY